MPPRYLLQQWTDETLRIQDRDYDGHGVDLWATPSTKQRLLDLQEDDVVLIAAVQGGVLLPVSAVTVARTATRDELIAEGRADDELYDLPYFAVGKAPFRPMNLRWPADRARSQSIRKADGTPLARSSRDPEAIAGQAFREPQWIDERSATALLDFLDAMWQDEGDEGLDDPGRTARGQAPRVSPVERRAIESRAMQVARELYEARGFEIDDVSADHPWDLTATDAEGREVHIEVKGTTGVGAAVIVTAGERHHLEEAPRLGAVPALVIVSTIELSAGAKPKATGGTVTVHAEPWTVDAGRWTETVWRYEHGG